MMGCSNPHPHCQTWSGSVIPTIPAKELEYLRRYSQEEQTDSGAPKGPNDRPCLLCDYANLEARNSTNGERVVVKNEHWVAVVPWWATWPFEILR